MQQALLLYVHIATAPKTYLVLGVGVAGDFPSRSRGSVGRSLAEGDRRSRIVEVAEISRKKKEKNGFDF